MGNLSSFNQGLVPSTFSELTQIVGCLVDDIETAKKFSASQVQSLTVNFNSVISERDEALISLSLLKEQHESLKEQQKEQLEIFNEQQKEQQELLKEQQELLKEQQEVDLQEKDELRLQCSVLQNELDLLKHEVSIKSAELESSKTEISRGQQEIRTILRQLHQLQSELERYFLLSRNQSKLLEASAQLQSRSTALLLKATI